MGRGLDKRWIIIIVFLIHIHRSGKSKGIAYIEFESETAAKTAVLKMDQYELNGQTVSKLVNLYHFWWLIILHIPALCVHLIPTCQAREASR